MVNRHTDRRLRGVVFGFLGAALFGCQSSTRLDPGIDTVDSPRGIHGAGSLVRFATGGPDADEYSARLNYPIAAINRPRFFVGTFSHQASRRMPPLDRVHTERSGPTR